MSLDPDESLAQIEEDVRRSNERAAQMPAFEAAIAAVRGSASSPARDVYVQVDGQGRVQSLRLGETALARGAQRLASDIIAVIVAAEKDAQTATLDAVTELLGPTDPILEQLRTPDAR
ncbi:YbaB/EbfC family nucleoid-associated protein [Microbacterium sp. NPDC089189]|uniref:YbaB/EbfC family nucleoid-associated protein n=1 Tax=Microbacterium sp. NPDC089189 TaxID=3154972 RepID=UPI0034138839